MRNPFVGLLYFLTLSHAAGAAEFTEHHAHVHGTASLQIATDSQQLSITLDSPAQNLLGFEHAPRNATETGRAVLVSRLLADPQQLFQLSTAAQCHLVRRSIETPQWQSNAEHVDYEATFEFTCAQPVHLRSVKIDLSALLQSGTRVTVLLSTSKGQYQQPLAALKTSLSLP